MVFESEDGLEPQAEYHSQPSDCESTTPLGQSLESTTFHRLWRCTSETKLTESRPWIGISRAFAHNGTWPNRNRYEKSGWVYHFL